MPVPPDSLRLVVLIDVGPGGEWKPDLLAAVLRGGATLVQLRGKEAGARALLEAARNAKPACRERGVPLLVNDRPDVACAAGADGVHVGPSDLPPTAARTIVGTGILGVSARTPDRIRLAEEARADYLGVGALHPSRTKPEAHVLGLKGIGDLIQSTLVPVVVIGGVTPADLPHLRTLGAAGIAVHSGITDSPDPESATRAYRTAWGS